VEDGGGHVVEFLHQLFAGGDRLAEAGVDEGTDGGFARLDGLVDGGVIRDVEDEELAEADAEDIAGFGIEFPLPEFGYPMVEDAAVAEDAEEDRLEKAAVGRGKHPSLGMALDEAFGIVMAFRPGAEGGDGGLADVEVFGRQNSNFQRSTLKEAPMHRSSPNNR